jgi:hypothetical protein
LAWYADRMPAKNLKTLDVRTRRAWRNWLQKNHASESEVWLVFHKGHTDESSILYSDAIDEALCFGWVDSLVKRLDEDRYARKFTPRKPDSRWSTINRRRYAAIKAAGLLAPAGLERAPTDRNGDAPRPSITALPSLSGERTEGPRAGLGVLRETRPLLSAELHRLGRFGQARRNEAETNARND